MLHPIDAPHTLRSHELAECHEQTVPGTLEHEAAVLSAEQGPIESELPEPVGEEICDDRVADDTKLADR